mgnify:FL=1
MGEGALDVTADLNAKSGEGWQTANISLSCFADLGTQMGSVIEPIIITAEGLLKLQITSVKLTVPGEIGDCDM